MNEQEQGELQEGEKRTYLYDGAIIEGPNKDYYRVDGKVTTVVNGELKEIHYRLGPYVSIARCITALNKQRQAVDDRAIENEEERKHGLRNDETRDNFTND